MVPPTEGELNPDDAGWSALRAELRAALDCFDAADRQLLRATVLATADRELAEQERREAMGKAFAAKRAIADLFLFMLRQAQEVRKTECQTYLVSLLVPLLEQDGGELVEVIRGVVRRMLAAELPDAVRHILRRGRRR